MSLQRILVVGDEPMLSGLLSHILADEGFVIFEADHGESALEVAHRCGHLDMVITDINMPVMGGVEFAREFRRVYPTVPILFISGRPQATPPEDILTKPFQAEELLEAVSRMLLRRPSDYRTIA